MMELSVNAYAKINLNLYIKGKRPDGYHELSTVMHSLPLCDRVSLRLTKDKLRVACENEKVPCDERNIVCKAANAYFAAADLSCGADITIEKNIPVAGGFGGSSTDGAAVLFMLEKHFAKLGKDRLFSLAASLSADMPFLLAAIYKSESKYSPLCADCSGIGEIMNEISSPIENKFVLAASCGDGLSAKEMYAKVDIARQNDCKSGDEEAAFSLYNDFESVAFELRPDIAALKDKILACGAQGALMSGSGSGVFGIFASEEAAVLCAQALAENGNCSAVCRIG